MGPFSIEEALAAEAAAIHDLSKPGIKAIVDDLHRLASSQTVESKRADKDADARSGGDEDPAWVRNRKQFYCRLGQLGSAALCCSGGGIRSATFCLGIIQSLAKHSLKVPPPPDTTEVPEPGTPLSADEREAEANLSLLSRFHYLSTVSGGGYIGSWLSAWRHRDDFPTVWQSLSSRPDGPDVEPAELSWLRAYSNYLTPKTGLLSADTWTGVAIYLRNLLLNWLVIIPALSVLLLLLKLTVSVSVWVARLAEIWWPHLLAILLGVACLVVGQAFTTRHRPTNRVLGGGNPDADDRNVNQPTFLRGSLIWSLLSALFVTSAMTSAIGVELAGAASTGPVMAVGAGLGVLIFAAGWLTGWPVNRRLRDFSRWAFSGAIYGGCVGLGAHLYTLMMPYAVPRSDSIWLILVPVILGVPWVLLSQLLADLLFVGLVSYEKNSDADREWLGRASGWIAATALIWILTTFISFAGGYFLIDYAYGQLFAPYIASAGGLAGAVAAWLGKSGLTGPANSRTKSDQKDGKSLAAQIGIAIAGPIFGAVLVVGIAVGLDLLLLGDSLVVGLTRKIWSPGYIFAWLTVGLIVTVVVAWVASRNVNINRFSIHALYRNRLVRAYLGASRQERSPDLFTGFDSADNFRIHEAWPPQPRATTGSNTFCLFHVVNITLNVVKTARLAWQQRKAESFTVTPLHSGSSFKGYRLSREYGSELPPGGISLGTAMAVSGAAASPNMGYHSSPSTAILLALFNVRLGWWLGNPGKEGDATYIKEGPSTAIVPLAQEAFGLTTDSKPWVYLSDGGHFENLGIYEMVRRRCRFIVAIDGSCDPDFVFEDLGNALRKIYIDLGVRIEFKTLDLMQNRPDAAALKAAITQWERTDAVDRSKSPIPYYAIGSINYKEADGPQCDDGIILYIKPALHGTSGTEGAGVRSYGAANLTFPHESTADQWFTESQFESYRSLGLDIGDTLFGADCVLDGGGQKIRIQDILARLSPTARS
ncbi:MAG: hypothetical protein GC182_07985 [Rhodopseudomonas sp.]|nr:hypothetical protein [Rhodopseudomonas sp.]